MSERLVVVQKWEESERGWGVRPDGYSIHLTEEDRVAYIDDYCKDRTGPVPDEYDRPCGKPYVAQVSPAVYKMLHAYAFTHTPPIRGIRFFDSNYPGTESKS